tara:strand:- start:273 stop:797 length:525 start_codon:yes stop_codon:yes gene_type:complete
LTYIKRGNLEFRPCVISDVDIIVDNMRLPDIRECALVGVTPQIALNVPFVEEGSKGFTITHKQKPVAMCGVTPLDDYSYRGKIWFLGTDDIDSIAKSFYKYSKLILSFLSYEYDYVENYVPVDHEKTIKWLQWIGFEIEKQQYFVDEHEFCRLFYCNPQKIECNSKLSERPVLH